MKRILPAVLLLTVLHCCFAYSTFAQKNFTPGYLVTLQNDTINGLINDKNWQKTPTKVQFKASETGEVQSFKASDIKGFKIASGDIYVAEVVTIDRTTSTPGYYQAEAITDTAFLRVLARGAATLLYLYDGKKDHFYYQNQTDKPAELTLTYVKKDGPNSGNTALVKVEKYKGQLIHYFRDCPAITKKLSHISYSATALRNVFQEYNACVGNEQYVTPKEKAKFQFGVIGGPALTSINFPTTNRKELADADFGYKPGYQAGIAVNIILPRGLNRWSIYNELVWKPYAAKGHNQQFIQAAWEYRTYDTEFEVNSAGLGTMLRYQLPLGKVTPFINAGMAYNLNFNAKGYEKLVVSFEFSDSKRISEGQPVHPYYYKKHEQAVLVGAGMKLGQASVEMRSEIGNGFIDPREVATTKTSFSFLFGYYFN